MVRARSPRRRSSLWLLLLLLGAAALWPARAQGASSDGLTRSLKRERSALQTLEELAGKVVNNRLELEDLRRQKTSLDWRRGEADRQIKALETRATQRREQIRTRARSLYKLSRGGFARLLIDAEDGRDMARRLSALRLILRRDVQERRLYRRELDQLAGRRAQLRGQRRQHNDLTVRLERQQAQLVQAERRQRQLLGRLTTSRRLQAKLTEELSTQQRRLLRQIATLTYELRFAGGFAASRGKLPAPVHGRVVGVFGRGVDSEHGVEVLRHGLTFRPASRARVRAVARGVARLAGPLAGYGELVLLDHGDGFFSLYGFLGALEVKAGEEVSTGQTVGRAGLDPLTARPALYFELRRKEQPLDPASWIRP